MAENEAIGAALVIPSNLLIQIRQADSLIEKLAKTSENTEKRMRAAFSAMAGDVDPLITKLKAVQEQFGGLDKVAESLSKVKSGGNSAKSGMDSLNQSVSATNNNLTTTANLLNTINSSKGGSNSATGHGFSPFMSIDTMRSKKSLMEFARGTMNLLDPTNKEPFSALTFGITALKQQIGGLTKDIVPFEVAMRSAFNAKDIPTMATALAQLKNVQATMTGDTEQYREKLVAVNAEIQRLTANMKALKDGSPVIPMRTPAPALSNSALTAQANEKREAEERKAAEERAKIEERATKKAQEEAKKRAAAYREANAAQLQTPQGAIDFAKHAGTINRQEQALKNLKAAYNNIQGERNYVQIQAQLKIQIDRLTESLQREKAARDQIKATPAPKELNLSQISGQINSGVFRENGKTFEALFASIRKEMLATIKEGKSEQLNLLRQLEPAIRERAKSYANLMKDGVLPKKYSKDFAINQEQLAALDAWQQKLADVKKRYGELVAASNESFQKQVEVTRKAALKTQLKDDASNFGNLDSQRQKNTQSAMSQYYQGLEKEQQNYINNKNRLVGELDRLNAKEKELEAAMAKAKPGVDTSGIRSSLTAIRNLQSQLRTAMADQENMAKKDFAKNTLFKSEATTIRAKGNEELRELRAANKAKEDELKRFRDNYEKIRSAQLKRAQANRNSFDGAMTYSQNAKSLQQERQAVEALKTARERLNLTTPDGQQKLAKLNEEIRKHNTNIENAVRGSKKLKESHSGLLNISQQLGRQLALMFSVSQVEGYISSIAKVRGEMELQQVALRSIIQNRAQADQIFLKTKALATQSPFRVGQLVTYTKQLAAYRIESDKLFDTTKRLADVSAGLGVDMQRLILAYGQVKAAAYLRGTEVRQFTEAGVNMYGELQSYFQEVKGEAYTTAQIVDMISKRKVTFEDVAAVFERLTNQGGLFYNMQQIQSETLYGKMEKLKDQIYLMKDAIGKDNEGLFKGSVDAIAVLLRHWRAVLEVGKAIAGILVSMYATQKMITLMTGKWALQFSIAGDKIASVLTLFRLTNLVGGKFNNVLAGGLVIAQAFGKAFSTMGKLFLASLPLAALMAAINLTMELYSMRKKYNEMVAKATNDMYTAQLRLQKIDDTKKGNIQKALKDLVDEMNNNGYQITLPVKIEDKKAEELYKAYKDEYSQFIVDMNGISAAFAADDASRWWSFGIGAGKWRDNLTTNSREYEESVGVMITSARNLEGVLQRIVTVNEKGSNLTKEQREQIENLTKDFDGSQKSVERLGKELSDIFKDGRYGWRTGMYDDELQPMVDFIKSYKTFVADYNNARANVIDIFGDPSKYTSAEDKRKLRIRIDKAYLDHELDDTQKQVAYRTYNIHTTVDRKSLEKEVDATALMIQEALNKHKYKINISVENNTFDRLLGAIDKYQKFWNNRDKYKKLIASGGTIRYDEEDTEFNRWYQDALWQGKRTKKLADGAIIPKSVAKKYLEYLEGEASAVMTEYDAFPDNKNNNKNNKETDIWQERIKVLQDMHAQYEKVRQYLGKDSAVKLVRENFAEDLQKVGMPDDITKSFIPTEEGLIEAYDKLIKKLPAKLQKKKMELERLKADLSITINEKKLKQELDDAKKLIDKSLNGVELRNKLGELGLKDYEIDRIFPELKALPRKLDDVMPEIWERLKVPEKYRNMSVEALFDDDKNKGIKKDMGKERFEKYRDEVQSLEKKIADNRMNTMQSLLKEYKNKLDEHLKLQLWYVSESNKISETVKDPVLASELQGNLDREKKKKEQELQWKDFQDSELYITAFKNIDDASTHILKALNKELGDMRGKLNELPVSQMRAMVKAQEDVNSELAERHPFDGMIADIKTYIKYLRERKILESEFVRLSKLNREAQNDVVAKGFDLDKAKNNLSDVTNQINTGKDKDGKTLSESELAALKEEQVLLQSIVEGRQTELDAAKALLDKIKADLDDATSKIQRGEQAGTNIDKRIEKIQSRTQKAAKVAEQFAGIWSKKVARKINLAVNALDSAVDFTKELRQGMKDLGIGTKSAADKVKNTADKSLKGAGEAMDKVTDQSKDAVEKTVEAGKDLAEGVGDSVKTTATATAAAISTVEKASVILAVISAALQVAMAIASLFNDDEDKQEEIEDLQSQVDALEWSYERLKNSMDDAYDTAALQAYYKQSVENLKAQAAAYRQMAAAERSKKDSDESTAVGYERQAAEIEETIAELSESLKESLGGFGSAANYKSAAEEFADAWVEAFNEGSDALDALDDKMDEYFTNLIKKQLLMRASTKFLEPIFEKIDAIVDEGSLGGSNGYEVVREELKAAMELAHNNLKDFSEYAYELMDELGWTGTDSSLSALQQGIEGITENTAEALESLLNSIRFFIANQSADVNSILSLLREQNGQASEDNPMLVQLREQTGYLRELRDMFSSAFVLNASQGGRGLKVFVANL